MNLNSSRLSASNDPQHYLTLNGNYHRWVVSFLQNCYYKWWLKKCLGLAMVNLIIFILKNGLNDFFYIKKFTKFQIFTQKKFALVMIGTKQTLINFEVFQTIF